VSTAADAFREIDNLAGEARRASYPDGDPQVVRGNLAAIQLTVQHGLREALADEPKLEACYGLLAACEAAHVYFEACGAAWQANDGILVSPGGRFVVKTEGLDQLCDTACDAVALALTKTAEIAGEPT
jgi:hypothetical protein